MAQVVPMYACIVLYSSQAMIRLVNHGGICIHAHKHVYVCVLPPALQAALYSTHPWESLALHWRNHISGREISTSHAPEHPEDPAAEDSSAPADTPAEQAAAGGKSNKVKRKTGPSALAGIEALLRGCGCERGVGAVARAGGVNGREGVVEGQGEVSHTAAVAAAAVAAQAFVVGLVLGERAHQVRCMLGS